MEICNKQGADSQAPFEGDRCPLEMKPRPPRSPSCSDSVVADWKVPPLVDGAVVPVAGRRVARPLFLD